MDGIKAKIKNNKVLYKILYPIVYRIRYFIYADCRTFVFFLKYFLRKIHVIKYDRNLVSVESKYKGKKRVFVVATGPSLKIEDLDWLKRNNEICISCNSIFDIYNKTDWRPDYYFINDYLTYDFYKEKNDKFKFDDLGTQKVFLTEDIKKYLDYKPDSSKVGFVPICYFDHWIKRPSRKEKYSKDLKNVCYDLYTVTNSMIALADYMGFQEIYLLGVDCNYYGGKLLYVGQTSEDINIEKLTEKEKEQFMDETTSNFIRGFRVAKMGTEEGNVKVYNATRGGSLEVFERVSMDDIIAGII